jgi:Flp pilus assembly protein TadB
MIPASTLVVILGGAIVGVGIFLLVVATTGTERRPVKVRRGSGSAAVRARRRILIAVGVGLVTLVVTGWPVAAVGAAAFAVAAPALLGGAKAERQQTARLEGLASWTESLRDTIAGAVGLEQAIPATVYAAAPAIQPQLRLLVDRLRVRVPLPVALRGLADDLDDPSADLVVAALVLNARLRGPGLRQVLTSLSEAARAELEMRQRVTAGRSSTRRSAQIVTVFSLAAMTLLTLVNPDYVASYDSAQGQLVLTVVAGLFAVGFWWMKRLSGVDMPARFLVSEEDGR